MALHILVSSFATIAVAAPLFWLLLERLPKAGIAWIDFLERLDVYREKRRSRRR